MRVVVRVQDLKTAVSRTVNALGGQYGTNPNQWSARDKQKLTEAMRVFDGQTVVVAKDQRLFDVLNAADQQNAEAAAAAAAVGGSAATAHADRKHSISSADAKYVDAVSASNGTIGSGAAALISHRFVLDRAFQSSLTHSELYARSIRELVRSTFEVPTACTPIECRIVLI